MLKYIGDFNKLKDYGLNKSSNKEEGVWWEYCDNRGTNLIITERIGDYNTPLRKLIICCGHRDFENDYASTILYDLIKDGLVIKEESK